MWTDLVFIGLLVLPCAVSASPPEPIEVGFSSVNLRNVLQWSPGKWSPDNVRFTVEYAIYGRTIRNSKGKSKIWRPVRECTEILRTWCDLSTETRDEEQGYYARVRAIGPKSSSDWVRTERFDPKSETVFGAPEVSVEIDNNSAIISVKGPMRYPSNNHTLPMKAIYPHMFYNLSIHNTHLNEMRHIPVVTSPYKYQLMEFNTKYCFSAKIKFLSIQMRSQSSEWYCITTPKDPVIEQLQSSLVGIVVPALCICVLMVVGYVLYHYLTASDQKSPPILKIPPMYPLPPEIVKEIPDIVIVDKQPRWTLKDQLKMDTPPRYPPDYDHYYGRVGEEAPRASGPDDGNNQNIGTCEHHRSLSDDVYAPQVTACNCLRRDNKGGHLRIQEQPEASPLLQVEQQPGVNVTLPPQTQAPVQSSEGEGIDVEPSGLFISRNPVTGLFSVHLSMLKEEAEEGGGADGNEKGGQEGGNRSEKIPLLSGYVSQRIRNQPPVPPDESDFSADYSCVLALPAAQTAERYESGHEREGGDLCVDWIPRWRPQMEVGLNPEKQLEGLKPSERGAEAGAAGKDEAYMAKGGVGLKGMPCNPPVAFGSNGPEVTRAFPPLFSNEDLYTTRGVKPAFEKEEELQRGEETDVDDFLSKWDLVLSSES
ncbi:interleukin-20 receptor subunit alpha [Kryptolebias marmoratus]|uniref:Uncharacterized LOC108231739 n=1 Tax=Kryptolebias marmoratus TaxID=37003 RepID=A0A3Q3B7D8_KRYMA|nr:interleukin-20 receptor subunit alpha [Kryptolebias marmoratus]